MNQHVHSAIADGIMRIEIRRPEKRNAITAAMYQAMADALRQAQDDPAVRVVLLHGQPSFFTAGNDLVDFLHRPPSSEQDPVFQFLLHIMQAEKPIVAAVAGPAVGIGTTLLPYCDYVVAADSARFSTPFVDLGLCPEAGSSLMLPLSLGMRRAAELLLFGETIDAATACDWGLVNRVVSEAQLFETAMSRAALLAAKPVAALRMSKSLLRRHALPLALATMRAEAHAFQPLLAAPEAKEAFAAFLDKRAPNFSQFN